MSDIPRHLYHYTKVNNLGLILSNQTIRFSSLNEVNDPLEGKSSDIGDLGMYLFVSCWTARKKEYLPLWNMYTPEMRGVRIKLPFPIFEIFKTLGKESYFRESELINKSYIILPNREPIRKIIYTRKKDQLIPKTLTEINKQYEGINLDVLGSYKDSIWKFENEWRFFFSIFPKPQTMHINDSFKIDELTQLIDTRRPLGFNHYNIKIKDESFKKMEIILGPRMKPGDSEIVTSLVNRYNPTAKIYNSSLTQRIK